MEIIAANGQQNYLELDDESLKTLDVEMLRKVLPAYEKKFKKEIEKLEHLQTESRKKKQLLDGLELKKCELGSSIEKLKNIDKDLSVREKKVLQEYEKGSVMTPIYQHKMSHFLSDFKRKDKETNTSKKLELNQILHTFVEEKHNLQEKIEENKKIIDEFVNKYLN